MQLLKQILIQIISLSTIIFAQVTQEKIIDIKSGKIIDVEENDQARSTSDIFILDHQISKDDYILGPGDELALSMITSDSRTINLLVSPTGDLVIPSIGIIHVGRLSIKDAAEKVKKHIQREFYPTAQIDLILTNIREFKVKILGAVNDPGYVKISSNQRLYDVIQSAGGLHRDADETNIMIKGVRGNAATVSLKYFNNIHNDLNNPLIKFQDIITIPYEDIDNKIIDEIITAKKNPINITGYAHDPGEYPYYMAFTVIDYINMAGGVLDNGSIQSVILYRKGEALKPELTDFVLPGDQLYIPSNLRYKIFGESSLIRTVTAVLSLYLTFLAISD